SHNARYLRVPGTRVSRFFFGSLLRKKISPFVPFHSTMTRGPFNPYVKNFCGPVELWEGPLRGVRGIASVTPDSPRVVEADPDASLALLWRKSQDVL
ncbi:hypothetical protein E4U60_007720, partial [Claviceps pazoutovae]